MAGQAGQSLKNMLHAFLQQNAGGDAHDLRPRGRASGSGLAAARNIRRYRGGGNHVLNNAPGAGRGQGWDYTDYANMSHGDMMKKAWQTSPAGSNLMAPRGHGYYDAFANHATTAMTNMSIGPATPISAKARCPNKELPLGIDTGKDPSGNLEPQLLIIGPAAGSTQGTLFYKGSTGPGVAPAPTDPIQNKNIDATALPAQTYPTTPPEYVGMGGDLAEVIPVRCSVRIRNFSAEINRGGIIHVLRMTTGINMIPGNMTNADFDSFCDGIRDHARTRTYEGADFSGTGLQKNCVVADQSRSLAFQNFNQATISTDVPWALDESIIVPGGAAVEYPVFPVEKFLYDPTYTPIAILFEPFVNVQPSTAGKGNTYGVTIQTQFLAHYKQGTMLANMAMTPLSDMNKLNTHRNKEEATESNFQKIMDYAVPIAQFAGGLAPLLL